MPDAETSLLPPDEPPQRPASRASGWQKTAGGQDARPPLFVFAARRKPPPTSWSRAALAGYPCRLAVATT
jgi:hypothetical protein